MKVSDLTESERKVWQSAATGAVVDLRVGNPELDAPEKWAEWGTERTVRAEVIADLLLGDGEAATTAVRGVRVRGARIVGDLDLKATTLRCPLALLNCSFTSALNLEEAMALSVCLSGSHIPVIRARQLQTHGDLRLDKGFTVSLGVELVGAHIGGVLGCTRGRFSNPDGSVLTADMIIVDQEMDCDQGFLATGEVRLIGAHIGGQLDCAGGQFSNPGGRALTADSLSVDGSMHCGEGFSATGEVRLLGAHIGGQLHCTGGQFSNPGGRALTADGLTVERDMFCPQGFSATGEVRLAGAHISGQLDCTGGQFSNPGGVAFSADVLTVDQDMGCREGFSATGEVRLSGAHIGSQLSCTGGHFSNADGVALTADGLTVDGVMFCNKGFAATGEVRLLGAHIRGPFSCTGGQFSNPDGYALNADGLTVDQDMYCREGFSATGEVRLLGAHIGGQLGCTGGQFSNPNGYALSADGLSVDRDVFCPQGFSATGEVSLLGAHIGGQLDCHGGQFSNPNGYALNADGLIVDRDMICSEGFSATGEVRLLGAHIGGQLSCTGGQFSNSGGSALTLERATVSGPLRMDSAVLHGILDLTAAKTSSYHDDPATWPQKLRLDGFVYDAIEGATVNERLEKSGWLRRNEKGYSPQIYEQLAAVYHHDGRDGDARRILIEKQRRRFAEGNFASEGFFASKVWRFVSRVGGFLLDWMVGYGYRTWYALGWVAVLLVLGTILFNYLYSAGDLTAANKATAPPFQPFLYTLDLLLPIASLHQRDGWVAQGAAQGWSVFFIIMGWILATAVVLSLTGLLKRDVK